MKSVSVVTDEKLEDLMDIIIAEARKDERSIPWETVKDELLKEGKINVSNPRKAIRKKRA